MPELALIGAALACLPIALMARSRWTAVSGVCLVVSVFWMEARCGGAENVNAAVRWMRADFSDFGVVLPLAGLMASAALWMLAVPVEAACRDRLPGRGVVALWVCIGPGLAGLFFLVCIGLVVDSAGGVTGWSLWQDTVAQFCLPVGAVAAVAGQAAALRSGDPVRAACWTAAACGGWVLMAAGRADGEGWGIGGRMLMFQPLALAAWLLSGGGQRRWIRSPGPGSFLSVVAGTAAAVGLAGLWPMEGSFVSRWGLIREVWSGGFGLAWDRVMVVACAVSWALALATWLRWAWRSAWSIRGARN